MIEAPKWINNPKADVRGWRDRRTGELLLAKRFTLEEVQAFEDARAASFVADVEAAVEGTDGVVLVSNEWNGDDLITVIDVVEEPEFSTGNPETGFTLEDLIAERGKTAEEEIAKDEVAQAVAEVLSNDDGEHIQAPVTAFIGLDFEAMTKDELLNVAELHSIEVYKSWTKDKIIAALT